MAIAFFFSAKIKLVHTHALLYYYWREISYGLDVLPNFQY